MYAPSSPPSRNSRECLNIERLLCLSLILLLLFLLFFLLFLLFLLSLYLSQNSLSARQFGKEFISTKKLSLPKTKRERNRFCLFCKKDKTLDIFLCFILLLCRVARDPNFSLSLQMLSCTHIVMSCFHVSPVTVTRHVSPVTPPSINHVFTASQK